MKKYFAYGSNMDEARMKERNIKIYDAEPGIAKNIILTFNKIAFFNDYIGYANIELEKGRVVEGIIYTIEDDDVKKLDKAEGYPSHYNKWKLKVEDAEGDRVECFTYVANPARVRTGLKPTRDYLQHLLAGKAYLSDNYFKKLSSIICFDGSIDNIKHFA